MRILRTVLVLVLAATLAVNATPQGRAAVRATIFATQVVRGGAEVPAPSEAGPAAERVSFPLGAGVGVGDVYKPAGGGRRPGVLLFLGVAPAGADDPRVVNLGRAFARVGMIAMFYWSPEMAQERITTNDVGNVASAFEYLHSRPDVDPRRVGMGGFCVGGAFALMAAAEPQIAGEVRYVNSFGAYYDLRSVAVSILSHSQTIDGRKEAWAPDALTREVFTGLVLQSLQPGADTDALAAAIAGGQSLPPELARVAVNNLPPSLLEQMDAASPKRSIAQVKAKVLLMDDRHDPLMPAAESRSLADALESQGRDTTYTEFAFFEHMDPTRPVPPTTYAREALKLSRHLYAVMRAAW